MIKTGYLITTDLVWNPAQGDLWQPVSSLPAYIVSQTQRAAIMPLAFEHLTARRETIYLRWVVAWSVVVWLAALLSIFIIPFVLLLALSAWFANGLLVARLRADAVEVSKKQMPELYNTFLEICQRLTLKKIPELYIVQSNGALNAFTMKHCGRNFVVLCSDLLDAYGHDSAEVRFLLGHEIGHIKRNHILAHMLLAPGMFVPLLGPAYSRACETSCDRFGAYAANDVQASMTAMMVLSGGKTAKKKMSADVFASQYNSRRGFFVSWYELISGYPTISQRVAAIKAIGEGTEFKLAPRHPLAYFFALVSPAPPGGGSMGVLIPAAIIALLAAAAIPSFIKARNTARKNTCSMNLHAIDACKQQAAVKYHIGIGEMVPKDKLLEFSSKGKTIFKCPAGGGLYTIQPLGVSEMCSVHGMATFGWQQQDNWFWQSTKQKHRKTCVNNLIAIHHAKQQAATTAMNMRDSDIPTGSELQPFLQGQTLVCPDGGMYSINAIVSRPTCSKGLELDHILK